MQTEAPAHRIPHLCALVNASVVIAAEFRAARRGGRLLLWLLRAVDGRAWLVEAHGDAIRAEPVPEELVPAIRAALGWPPPSNGD